MNANDWIRHPEFEGVWILPDFFKVIKDSRTLKYIYYDQGEAYFYEPPYMKTQVHRELIQLIDDHILEANCGICGVPRETVVYNGAQPNEERDREIHSQLVEEARRIREQLGLSPGTPVRLPVAINQEIQWTESSWINPVGFDPRYEVVVITD